MNDEEIYSFMSQLHRAERILSRIESLKQDVFPYVSKDDQAASEREIARAAAEFRKLPASVRKHADENACMEYLDA